MRYVYFKSLKIKNFLSVGDTEVKIDFKRGVNIITGDNKDKPERRNGCGKCVDPSTEIDINIEDPTVLAMFKKFTQKE